jgi:hypothetical protein
VDHLTYLEKSRKEQEAYALPYAAKDEKGPTYRSMVQPFEKALVQFNEAVEKQFGLTQDQVFDYHQYFHDQYFHDQPATHSEVALFQQYYQLVSFVIQYALVYIRLHSGAPQLFSEIIMNRGARTKLLTLVEILWNELAPNRGAQYVSAAALKTNQQIAVDVYAWFKTHKQHTPDNWDNEPSKGFPAPADGPHPPRVRTLKGEFLCLVAQACFVTYEEAFVAPMDDGDDVTELLSQKIKIAAETVLQLLPTKKNTFDLLLSTQTTKVLFVKMISNYFAEKQVLAATAALNKDIARYRLINTNEMLAVIRAKLLHM